ncbi:hypothetical protein M404DRAFT_1007440, partial [Pisolithus tinctorius Marx 270]
MFAQTELITVCTMFDHYALDVLPTYDRARNDTENDDWGIRVASRLPKYGYMKGTTLLGRNTTHTISC